MKFLVSGLLLFLLGFVFLARGFEAKAAALDFVNYENRGNFPGQVLVKFKEAVTSDQVKQNIPPGLKVKGKIEGLDVYVLEVPVNAEEKVVAALSHNPRVDYAELDSLAAVLVNPDDPYFPSNQWGLENTGQAIGGLQGTVDADIDALTAWEATPSTTTQSAKIKIAILDTGIDQDHEDVTGKIVANQNYTNSPSPDDFYGHGTHVAGIAAALTNNGLGVAGVCRECTLMNVKVLNDSGSGAYSWIASGLTYAADNGAKVINMSLGGSSPSKTLENAVKYAWNKGVVVVAAAGNNGNKTRVYPAYYANAIAVAATDNQDKKASFSTFGTWVDLAAPGVNIYSTFPNHPYTISKSLGYDFGSGTSMATPMVAGVAGLVWSSPFGTSAFSVRQRMELTANKITGTGNYWSNGRINAGSAVSP